MRYHVLVSGLLGSAALAVPVTNSDFGCDSTSHNGCLDSADFLTLNDQDKPISSDGQSSWLSYVKPETFRTPTRGCLDYNGDTTTCAICSSSSTVTCEIAYWQSEPRSTVACTNSNTCAYIRDEALPQSAEEGTLPARAVDLHAYCAPPYSSCKVCGTTTANLGCEAAVVKNSQVCSISNAEDCIPLR